MSLAINSSSRELGNIYVCQGINLYIYMILDMERTW